MKLNTSILNLARSEANQHLLSDLGFSENLHQFLKKETELSTFLNADFGFKKFLFDYGVGRTLQGGDDAKLKILKLILKFQFEKNHVQNITSLANLIRQKGLSSNSSAGGPGLPQSFCSKLLYVYKPDEIIPYDAYVLKSLKVWSGQPLKSLEHYYEQANAFRQTHFSESSNEVVKMLKKTDPQFISRITALEIDPLKLLSWKLTDKYLWCTDYFRRKNIL